MKSNNIAGNHDSIGFQLFLELITQVISFVMNLLKLRICKGNSKDLNTKAYL